MATGELVFGEIAEDGRVELVCVVDDALPAPDGVKIYYSGEWQLGEVNGDGLAFTIDKAQLTGLSIVDRPANSEASPLRWRHGDLRCDRGGWPLSWSTEAPLLKRAADSLERGGLVGLRTRTACEARRPS